MATNVFLGIDIGTSGTKTLAIGSNGEILASASYEYPLSSPEPGWAEQDPHDWWKASVETVKAVIAKANIAPESVKGIGLSGQMHGSVFLDAAHNV
ncbi:MAG: xylulokinase, partial [Planctomycetaceae bacterium]|nr:xylulokinase [Planctomycetaceae bacterium]